jgi:hypothetical protein
VAAADAKVLLPWNGEEFPLANAAMLVPNNEMVLYAA